MQLDFEQYGAFPLLVRPDRGRASVDQLCDWLARGGADLAGLAALHGAVLLRGFDIDGAAAFESVCRAATPELLDYTGGGSPRSRITGSVYSSTEYPADQLLPMHSEYTYFDDIPSFIWFCCLVPPVSGGETPIGDMRRVLERLPSALVERFARHEVQYIYNLHGGDGFGRGWKEAFATARREDVEQWLDGRRVEYHWTGDGALHAKLIGPGLRTHEPSGAMVWGNQAVNWHVAALGKDMAPKLRRVYGSDERLPKHARFGDGSPIADEDVLIILDALRAEETAIPWQRGDIMLCDNRRVAHGRRPFSGERRVLVALA